MFVYSRTGIIKRISTSGDQSNSEEIVLSNLTSPRGIVVEPFTQYVCNI